MPAELTRSSRNKRLSYLICCVVDWVQQLVHGEDCSAGVRQARLGRRALIGGD